MMISNLFDKLSLIRQIELLDHPSCDRAGLVLDILRENYFLVELTIGEADTIHRYFLGGELDLKKLYNLFK